MTSCGSSSSSGPNEMSEAAASASSGNEAGSSSYLLGLSRHHHLHHQSPNAHLDQLFGAPSDALVQHSDKFNAPYKDANRHDKFASEVRKILGPTAAVPAAKTSSPPLAASATASALLSAIDRPRPPSAHGSSSPYSITNSSSSSTSSNTAAKHSSNPYQQQQQQQHSKLSNIPAGRKKDSPPFHPTSYQQRSTSDDQINLEKIFQVSINFTRTLIDQFREKF